MKPRPIIITRVDGPIPLRLLFLEQRRRGWSGLTLEGDGTWWLMHPSFAPRQEKNTGRIGRRRRSWRMRTPISQ